jgi:tetratricopeptide (TPR) repeat protein
LMLNGRNIEEALSNYNLAKESDRENPLPYGDLAEAYYRSGKMELAKQNIVEYLKLSDKSTRDQLRYGNILYLTKDYAGAEKVYTDLITKGEGKKTPSLYRGLAFAQYQNKDYKNALTSFDAYRAAVPESEYDYEDYLYYAAVNSVLAKEDTANADKYKAAAETGYSKALEAPTANDKKEVYRLIADAYKDTKEWGKVSEWYGKLVDGYPNEAEATDYFNAGYYAYFAKDFKTAETRLNAFNTKFPEENLGYFWLGRVLAAQDADVKTGIAAETFKTWLSRPAKENEVRDNKDLNYAYQYLMVLAYNKGQGKEAIDYAKKILEIMPDDKTAPQIIEHFNKKGIK